MTLCVGNSSQVITPYGLTRNIKITRGVRQGCPLSPTLFILFLNPLLQKLETNKLGYKLGDKALPGGAFADDIVLTTSSHKDMQRQFNICLAFFKHFGLEMAIDGRDKTVYTHNNPTHTALRHITLGKEVPRLRECEYYKYLGIHINLCLDWDKQVSVSNCTFYMSNSRNF